MKPTGTIADVEELDEFSGFDFASQAAAGWEVAEREQALERFRGACESLFERLDPLEAAAVRLLVARRPEAVSAARAFDEAGKGLMYPLLAAAALLVDGTRAFLPILACAIATAVSLALYPVLKQLVRRERPCAFDPELGAGVAPIDRFSWPSGHSITAIAFLVPFAIAGSSLLPLIAPLTLLVLWSRVALGHHYPTDVVGGSSIGAAIAWASAAALGL
jgi:undecaprenyl-diphosphatase